MQVVDILKTLGSVEPFSEVSSDDISVEPLQTLPHSEVYRLRVDSRDASFILKVPGPKDHADLARRERRFYRDIAPKLPVGLAPGCVAERDIGSSGWLLLEDLSGTHSPVDGDHVPTEQQSQSFIEALAALHGSTARMPEVLDSWGQVERQLRIGTLDERLSLFRQNLRSFVDAFRESLEDRTRSLLDHALPFHELFQAGPFPGAAIVHGDAHYGNGLFSGSSAACLIDWGMPMRAFGEIDVAHAIALNLPPGVRRARQSELHRVYLDRLAAHGIPPNPEAYRDRYRLGVLYAFASPVSWWRSGVPERVWRPALANLVDAADDLGLGE